MAAGPLGQALAEWYKAKERSGPKEGIVTCASLGESFRVLPFAMLLLPPDDRTTGRTVRQTDNADSRRRREKRAESLCSERPAAPSLIVPLAVSAKELRSC